MSYPELPPGYYYHPNKDEPAAVMTYVADPKDSKGGFRATFPFLKLGGFTKAFMAAKEHRDQLSMSVWGTTEVAAKGKMAPRSSYAGRYDDIGVSLVTKTRRYKSGRELVFYVWVAGWMQWVGGKRKFRHKEFSINVHGFEGAYLSAKELRAEKVLGWEKAATLPTPTTRRNQKHTNKPR